MKSQLCSTAAVRSCFVHGIKWTKDSFYDHFINPNLNKVCDKLTRIPRFALTTLKNVKNQSQNLNILVKAQLPCWLAVKK